MAKTQTRPTLEFKFDQSLRRHAIRVEGIPGLTRGQLTELHGVLDAVQDSQGWTVYLKPNCCREAAMQTIEAALGVMR